MINNLISALGTVDCDFIMEYLKRYDSSVEEVVAIVEDLVKKATNYYQEFILPKKQYHHPTEQQREMLRSLRDQLARYAGDDEDELITEEDFFKA